MALSFFLPSFLLLEGGNCGPPQCSNAPGGRREEEWAAPRVITIWEEEEEDNLLKKKERSVPQHGSLTARAERSKNGFEVLLLRVHVLVLHTNIMSYSRPYAHVWRMHVTESTQAATHNCERERDLRKKSVHFTTFFPQVPYESFCAQKVAHLCSCRSLHILHYEIGRFVK